MRHRRRDGIHADVAAVSVPPTAFGQNRCSFNEMYAYAEQCLFSGFSDPNTCATKLNAPNSLDCFQCLAPGTSSTGPLRSPKDACGQTPSFNIGGCLSNALGSSCASAWMTANECAEIACSECFFCGGGEDVPDYVHPCLAAGGNSSCDGVRSAAACALSSTSPVVQTCLSIDSPAPHYVDFMSLFCGAGPPTDAGTD